MGIYSIELKVGSWRRYLHTQVHSSIIHNSQKVEMSQVSTMWHMEVMDCYAALRKRRFCHMLQCGWTLRTSCKVKEGSHKKTNTVWFHLHVLFKNSQPWLVWLSGLSTSLWTKGWPVRFPVRAHAWVVGQVPSRGRSRGNHTLIFLSLSFSFPSSLSKNK